MSKYPEGYILVRDTTESLKTNRLSDKLQFWRSERPDEWTMDELIRDAQQLEAILSRHTEGFVPNEPTEAMVDAGVAMALQVSVHGEGGWSNYVRGLYKQMAGKWVPL